MRRSIAITALFLLIACGSLEAPDDRGDNEEPAPTTATTDSVGSETTSGMETDTDLVSTATMDLATRLKVTAAEIEVLEVEAVTWPDGSLGCPEPDQMYTQALVEGQRIILGHDGRVYLYHAGGDTQPFLCASDEADGGYEFVPPPGSDER
ncbi:MAG TPA: hypothetical protein VJ815_07400 [Acidimicrobiia bacterium]|nr:hypothetical protein [Acidimicrobiia bacterium]